MTLFNADPVDDDIPVPDVNKNYLEELVGEGKKFKTPEDLARGKATSDAFIEQLKRELASLRTELRSRKTVEELVARPAPNTPPVPPNNQEDPPEPREQLPDIDSLLEQKLTQRELANQKRQNMNTVRQVLKQSWGSQFAAQLTEVAESLGMTQDYLDNLAETSPTAFLKLVGLESRPDPRASVTPVPNRAVATERQPVRPQTAANGWSYWKAKQKEMGADYWSPKVQQQLWQDIQKFDSEDDFYKS